MMNIKPQKPDVFVIKRAHSGSCYSFASAHTSKRHMLAFTDKRNAQFFIGMMKQFQDKSRPHQQLKVERIPLDYLRESCMYSSLDLTVYVKDNQAVKFQSNLNNLNMVDMMFDLETRYNFF